ncbi:MAG: hypothetical protein [Caudoviricetes sp.]|nr:MAG: hypothetical protein [Caudoviricetes sp.]
MNTTTKLTNRFPLTVHGFYYAADYLLTDKALVDGYALTDEELKAYLLYPHGRREDFVAIIHRANKVRSEAHKNAMAINSL